MTVRLRNDYPYNHEFATRVAIEDHSRRQLKIRKTKVLIRTNIGLVLIQFTPYIVLRITLYVLRTMLCT